MDTIIVGVIVAFAIIFTVLRFVKIYKGEGSCECGGGCSCNAKDECDQDLKIIQ